MAQADALGLFTTIGLQQVQAQAMVAPLERIQSQVTQYQAAEQQRLTALAPTLTRARQILLSGEELPPDMQSALANYRQQSQQAQLQLARGVNQEMQTIASLLYPEQNALLDWTAPEAVRGPEAMAERLRLQQVALSRIQEAERMLERVKYLDPFNFVTGRAGIINDYLAVHFPPETPDFDAAYRIALEHTDRVRLLSENEWQANSWQIATDLVERLGLMPSLETAPDPSRISWSALYQLFTNPQTLAVVKELAGVQH
ncbi:MAG: hypothetical protein AB7Y46_16505, partial [Armatimonadota bacterium]